MCCCQDNFGSLLFAAILNNQVNQILPTVGVGYALPETIALIQLNEACPNLPESELTG
jgi:hypothetical protein